MHVVQNQPSDRLASRAAWSVPAETNAPTIVVTDAEGTVISVSGTFEANEGYSRYEVLGKNAADLKCGTRSRLLYRTIWYLTRRGKASEEPSAARDVPGDRGMFDVLPMFDALGQVTNFVAVWKEPAEVPSPAAAADETSLPEKLRRLAAGTAHNINNQLCVVGVYAELLLGRGKNGGGDEGRAELKQILAAQERMAATVRRLLACAQAEGLQPERTNLNAAASSFLAGLAAWSEDGIKVRSELAPDLGVVIIDRTVFGKVLADLAEYARWNMPRGGTVSLRTANVDLADSFVRQNVSIRSGRYVTVSFHYSGEGPAKRAGARIFEPFSEDLDEPQGLLLPAVYGGVRQNGGFLWVFTRPGNGTTFNIYLPRAE